MPKNTTIHIDNPCSEDWDRMTPGTEGRLCSSCKKTVVDFTRMSDQEVLQWLARPRGSVCGRFGGGQLNRGMIPQPERANSRLGLWRYLLAGLLVSSEVAAQDKPASPPISQRDKSNSDNDVVVGKFAAQPLDHSRLTGLPDTLRGRLIDSSSGLPVSYASITIDSHHGYSANEKGYFAIARKNISAEHTLKISAIGYKVLTIDVTKTWAEDQREKVLLLSLSENTLMGDIVVVQRTRHKKVVSLLKDSLAFTGLTQKALTVYPNPVSRGAAVTLSMRLDEPGTYSAQLFNTSGVLIETMKVEGGEKSKNVLMDIPPTLVAGIYFIRLSHPAVKKVYTQELAVF